MPLQTPQLTHQKGQLIQFRKPTLEDAAEVYALVDHCKPLDLNSRYAYMLICTHFANTSIIVEDDSGIVGLISGYVIPDLPEVFFVWQVAVHSSMRGKGVALSMAKSLLLRENLKEIHYIDTTISPSNEASQKLFRRLAAELNTDVNHQPLFDKSMFGKDAHEDEDLYRIGPITQHEISKGE